MIQNLIHSIPVDLEEGKYLIDIFVKDEAENSISSKIMFEIDHSIIDQPKSNIIISSQNAESSTDYLLIIVIGIIAIVIVSVLVILKQKSKIPQKN